MGVLKDILDIVTLPITLPLSLALIPVLVFNRATNSICDAVIRTQERAWNSVKPRGQENQEMTGLRRMSGEKVEDDPKETECLRKCDDSLVACDCTAYSCNCSVVSCDCPLHDGSSFYTSAPCNCAPPFCDWCRSQNNMVQSFDCTQEFSECSCRDHNHEAHQYPDSTLLSTESFFELSCDASPIKSSCVDESARERLADRLV